MTNTGTYSATALVINKDINHLEFLSNLLQKSGIEPVSFTEAESALKSMDKESPPSIIVTDLYMPVINGWKFCRMVRSPAFEPFNEIPVIIVSSVFSEKMALDIMSDLQADAFLPYPPEENHFIEKVHALIAGEKSEKPSVLIVEDDKNLSSVIKNIFERHGYMVHTALTACEAAEVFKKKSYDIALLNYNLRDCSGDTLRQDFCHKNPHCICLIMAEDITSELALKWMTDGASSYIKKPFEPEQIMELCARARREKVFIEAQKILERKTEESLRESEQKFRSYIENAPDGIFLLDETGKYLLVNDAACRITGFTREELMQKNLTELTYPDDIPGAMERFRKVVTYGEASGEGRFVTKSGEVRHWIVKAVKLNEKNFLGFAADITERRVAEEALRESESRLKKVLEILPVGVWITDRHGKIIQNNPAAEQIWSGAKYVGPEEFHEYKGWWYDTKKLITPGEWAVSRAFRKGEISREELIEIECFDGTHKIILNWAMPLTGVNQEIEGSVAVNQDITERKLMEENLKSAYTKLEALWSVSSMADADIKTISDHILSSIAKMTGSDYGFYGFINEDESVMTIHSWSGEAMKDCSLVNKPAHFPVNEAGVWAEAIRQRKPFILNDYNVDHMAKKGLPEGHVDLTNLLVVPFFSQGRIRSVAAVANRPFPYNQEDISQITSFLTGIQSIVEHKRTEVNLRLMADMLDEAPGSITVHDLEGKFLYANRKTFEIHGYNEKEFMSLNLQELDVPESADLIQKRMELINRYGETSFEVYHVRKDKTTFPLNIFAKKVKWNNIPALLSIATDITERKMAEEEKERLQAQLLQAQKMESVGRLAGGVAHDFNNMLGIILGFTELALEQVEQKHNLYDHLKSIEKAATRSADLTRQLLAFARKQTIAPKLLELNDTVSGMLRMIRRLIGEDIDLAWMPGARLWPVMVDPAQIDQILANLCVNARDAIKGVGKITIETENITFDDNYRPSHRDFTPGEYVMLSVSDDGCGMDKNIKEHLFEPFFTTKEIGKGTGLGLATVYGIVIQNRGFINVYSEPGMGSTFKIYLPRFVGKNREVCSRGTIEDIQKGSETVLLVEDEREMMDMIKIMLERLGYRVLTAITPLQALKLAEDYSGEINLLITDVVMPEMNGRYLAEKLMSLYGNMKCLFMSGYTANIIAHHGVLEEGLQFIEKPFTRKDLAAKIRKALGP